jgi:predicted transposase YdaD
MSTHFIPFPHDKLFKVALGQTPVAQEFFRRHLAPELLKRLDLTTLTLENTSFVDDNYKATEADLIYKVKLDGATAYLFALFEQQTTVVQDMAFRLEVYKLRVIERHHKQCPETPLPVVISLVLYTGSTPWSAPRELFSLFGEQESLARELWAQPYTLIDVCRIADDELLRDELSGIVQYVFKYRKNQRDFKQFIDTVVSRAENLEKTYPQAASLINALIRYIMDGIEAPNKEDLAALLQKARDSSSTLIRGNIMTFAQQ